MSAGDLPQNGVNDATFAQDEALSRARLRAAGLRATAPRLLVLQVLAAEARPLSHGELMGILAERGALDRATVYRNLNDLADAGLLQRLMLGDQLWRFELTGAVRGAEPHPHFVCTDCGGVQCLEAVEVRVAGSGAVPRAVARSAVAIQLSGRCDTCA